MVRNIVCTKINWVANWTFFIISATLAHITYDDVNRLIKEEWVGENDEIINAINYLCDEDELMVVRSRSLKIRMLDQTKIDESRLNYQMLNMLGPAILIIIFGLAFNYYRRKKYTAHS